VVREILGLKQGDPILFEERDGLIIMGKRLRPDLVWDANVSATLTEWEDSLDDDL
jgi:bifunctional DNA-binding transcriptional regulator/antitoxin component of YhaV-PrlF toxin-antitoxin module